MKYLIWAVPIVLVAYILHFVLGTVLGFIFRIFGRKFADSWLSLISVLFSKFVLFILGVDVEISGNRDIIHCGKPLCFISNHTSILDILLTVSAIGIPMGFIAKKELAYIPFFNLSALSQHVVFLDRKNIKKGIRAIENGVKKIKKGCSMLIFPEGTRSKTGLIAPFKSGSFRLATESKSLAVPLTIKGIRQALEDRKKCFQHTSCFIHIGEPSDTAELTNRNELKALAIKIESHINSVYQTLGDANNGK